MNGFHRSWENKQSPNQQMKQKVFENYQMTKKRFLKINYQQTILTMVIPTDAKRFLKINDARKIFKIAFNHIYFNSCIIQKQHDVLTNAGNFQKIASIVSMKFNCEVCYLLLFISEAKQTLCVLFCNLYFQRFYRIGFTIYVF